MSRAELSRLHDWPEQTGVVLLPREHDPVWAVLGARKLFLLLTTLAGIGLAASYIALVPPSYTSEAEILEDPRGVKIFGNEDLTPQGQAPDMNTALVETQLRVLTSDSVLRQVVAREGLARDPEFDGTVPPPIQAAIAFVKGLVTPPGRPVPPEALALDALRDRVRAVRPDRGFVVQLRVTTRDPDKSARLALAVARTYIEGETAARREVARRAGEDVGGRLDDLAARVKQAEDAVEAFKAKNRLVGASGELVSAQELSALNLQMVAAQTRTSELKARADQLQALARSGTIPDTIAESVRSATVTSLRTQFAEANRLQADTAARLGPRHPETQAIRAQIDRLRAQIETELARISTAARGEYERAQTNEQMLAASLQKLKTQALGVSQTLVRLRELERKAQASRAVYESYLSRSREIGEQQRVDTGNVRIISAPSPPLRPNGPSAPVIVLAGAAFGLGAGAVLAVLRAALSRRTVRAPSMALRAYP